MSSVAGQGGATHAVTPADEAHFIALWEQEASYREIAQALGCALGTVGSRASALVAQGRIQSRPRGGGLPPAAGVGPTEGYAPTRAEPGA